MSQLKMGIKSYGLIVLPQLRQRERLPDKKEPFSGSRAMTMLRKLPIQAPTIATMM